MRYFAVVAVLLVVGLLDYHFYSIVAFRGGFDAWTQANRLWDAALMYAFIWNLMGAVVLWAIWITRKDF